MVDDKTIELIHEEIDSYNMAIRRLDEFDGALYQRLADKLFLKHMEKIREIYKGGKQYGRY